jgi:hypothetical protein
MLFVMDKRQTPEAFTLSGDNLNRVQQALEIARHLAQAAGECPRGEHALTEIDEAIGNHLATIRDAIDDDWADAEENGDADRARKAWFPICRAT